MALNQQKIDTQTQIERLLDSTPNLPALPTAVFEVVRLAGDFNSSTSQIASAVSKDQGLSAKILQLANSAYYGLPREVAAVSDAVGLLGKASVRNLALLATAQRWHETDDATSSTLNELWTHAVAVAVASQTLADSVLPAQSEEAFCAGLLHNIGKVVLVLHSPDRMAKLPDFARKSNLSIGEAETKAFGFDHTEVGYSLGKRWDLPERILRPIRHHHDPSLCVDERELSDLVHVADRLAAILGTGLGTDHFLSNVDSESVARVGLRNQADLDSALAAIASRTRAAISLL